MGLLGLGQKDVPASPPASKTAHIVSGGKWVVGVTHTGSDLEDPDLPGRAGDWEFQPQKAWSFLAELRPPSHLPKSPSPSLGFAALQRIPAPPPAVGEPEEEREREGGRGEGEAEAFPPKDASCSSGGSSRSSSREEIKMQALATSPMAISSVSSSAACRFAPRCGRIVGGSASSSFGRSPCFLFLPFSASPARVLALRAVKGAQVGKVGGSHGASQDPGPLRRPLVSPLPEDEEEEEHGSAGGVPRGDDADEVDDGGRPTEEPRGGSRRRKPDWVDWEDQILQDTVPLVSFVRMILHSGK